MRNTVPEREPVRVAVGVVARDRKILITRRANHLDQGGLWEFPGGKLEAHETALDALRRELNEEIGILVISAYSMLVLEHDYADRRVRLDVWRVDRFSGKPYAREGQALKWVPPQALAEYSFPAANAPIIQAFTLRGCELL